MKATNNMKIDWFTHVMVAEGFTTTTSFSVSMGQKLAVLHSTTYHVQWLGLLRKNLFTLRH
jgi:hypothetical protein